jgi:hypothetical protein
MIASGGKMEVINLYSLCSTLLRTYKFPKMKGKKKGNL